MDWLRGEVIGHGSFGTVNLAVPRRQSPRFPALMAVKSCGASKSSLLMNEKWILEELGDCPQIIRCFGGDFSFENGEKLYNVLLEYASGRALSEKVRNSGERLTELDFRRYTESILKGLGYIHGHGYVHCDLKLQNVLLCSCNDGRYDVAKVADFGLAKKAGRGKGENSGVELRGTPLYMSPETVAAGEQEAPADVWALGCLVAEMVTGKPAWNFSPEADVCGLLLRIGVGDEVPEIPGKLSAEGKDFLGKCFVKDPRKRWTAEMLLNHPFVADHNDDHRTVPLEDKCEASCSTSPTGPFDFPDCDFVQSGRITHLPSPEQAHSRFDFCDRQLSIQPAERLRGLVTGRVPNWADSDSWVTAR